VERQLCAGIHPPPVESLWKYFPVFNSLLAKTIRSVGRNSLVGFKYMSSNQLYNSLQINIAFKVSPLKIGNYEICTTAGQCTSGST
jgi:hypothetical protein